MYKPILHKKASKYYQSLDTKATRRINKAIEKMIKNPFEGSHIKKLRGRLKGKYRYKVGSLRIVYSINKEEKVIYIEAIGPRGDVYKEEETVST